MNHAERRCKRARKIRRAREHQQVRGTWSWTKGGHAVPGRLLAKSKVRGR